MTGISPDEGRARIDEGERILRDAGLAIDGFVAPAWSMPGWLLPLLAERGCRFTEDHLRVYDPAGGKRAPSVVLNWATRSPGRLALHARVVPGREARAPHPARAHRDPPRRHGTFLAVRREIEHLLAWAHDDFVARGVDLLQGV